MLVEDPESVGSGRSHAGTASVADNPAHEEMSDFRRRMEITCKSSASSISSSPAPATTACSSLAPNKPSSAPLIFSLLPSWRAFKYLIEFQQTERLHKNNLRKHLDIKKDLGSIAKSLFYLVGANGIEPPTPTMSRWCSNQLSYAPVARANYTLDSPVSASTWLPGSVE